MNKLRVGVIGLGRAGMIHARNFATAVPEAELAVVVDPNPEALESALKEIHRIAAIGVRTILDRPAVAGVIIGARLGIAEHRADNARVFGLSLDPGNLAAIETVLAKSRDLMRAIGDCGDEYR